MHWVLCLKIKFLLVILGVANCHRRNLERVFIFVATLPLPGSQSISDMWLLIGVKQILPLDIIYMNSVLVLFKLSESRQVVPGCMILDRHSTRITGQ